VTHQEQWTSLMDQQQIQSLSLTRHRLLTIAQIEMLCEISHATYEKLSFELKDHPSRERILNQSKLVWDQARALLRDISLLDTELDPNRGQGETSRG